MKTEKLWERRYVTMRIVYKEAPRKDFTKLLLFDCDSRIAEAVRLFAEKGYGTSYNSYEGQPYREVPSEDDGKYYRKYKNMAFFSGGGLDLACSDDERKMILERLNAKGDYFSVDEHTNIWAARQFIRWEPLYTASIDGHKNSPARFESMTKIFRMVYEDIWRIVLEVAQEVPYKEDCWVESATILPGSEHSDDRSQRIYTLKQNGDFDYNENWMYEDLDEEAKAYLKAKAETEAVLTAYEKEKAAMNAEK